MEPTTNLKVRMLFAQAFIVIFVLHFLSLQAFAEDAIQIDMSEDTGIMVQDDEDSGVVEIDGLAANEEYHGVWGTCNWEITEYGSLIVHPGVGQSQEGKTQSPWKRYAALIGEVYFLEENGKRVEVSGSVAFLFADLYYAAGIDLTGLEMHNVTDMHNMFENCAHLKYFDIADFSTSEVLNMSYMFYGCCELPSVDVANWDVSNVRNMRYMFSYCNELFALDVSKWNTANVTDMQLMFYDCNKLSTLDVSLWNTSKVTDMAYMFSKCSSLNIIDVSYWDTSAVNNIVYMFSGCSKLEFVDMSSCNLSNITDFRYMFKSCSGLKSANFDGVNTSSARSLKGMFSNCYNLEYVAMEGWDTSKVTDMSSMFFECGKLISVDVDNWNTSNVAKMGSMFYGCKSLINLDVSNWETAKVNSYGYMYEGCVSLNMVVLGKGYAINGPNMFPNPTAIQGLWWSQNEHAWMSLQTIVSERSNMPDIYYSYNVDEEGTSIKDAVISFGKKMYGWTGSEVKPDFTVTLGQTVLRPNADYTVLYANNIDAGKGMVTIRGVGRYKDTLSATFTISYSAYFKDVNESTYHVEDIIWLANAGISYGWNVEKDVYEYRPSAPVARADMASFLYRLARRWGLVNDSWRATWTTMDLFWDVSSSTTPHYLSIWWLASNGISEGWPIKSSYHRNFRPYASVTRQDMAAFLFRLAKLARRGGASDTWTASAAAKKKFVDVDGGVATNHHDEIWWLAQTGVSTGWKVGSMYEFRGMQPVTRQDMAAFLHRMDNL